MPAYEYQNNTTGEVREIYQRMSDPHPKAVTFAPDGSWSEAIPNDPLAWVRVFGNHHIDTHPCTGQYPRVALDLPKGLPGCKTDKLGRTIVQSRRHENEICKKHGYYRHED